MKFSYFLRMLLLLMGITVFFYSCSENDDPFAALERQVSTGSREKAVIQLYFPGKSTPSLEELFRTIEKESQRDLNLELEVNFLPFSSYIDNIQQLLEEETEIDGFFYYPQLRFSGFDIQNLAREKQVMDISGIFSQNAPALTGSMESELLRAHGAGGEGRGMYLIPGYLPVAPKLTVLVREDFVNKFDIREIRDFNDLEQLLENIVNSDTEVFPLALNANPVQLFARSSGYEILNSGMELVYRGDDPEAEIMTWESTPEYAQGVRRVNSWMDKGYLNRQSIYLDPYMIISSGRWAVITSERGNDLFLNSYVRSDDSEYDYIPFTLFPDIPGQRMDDLGSGMAVSANSPHPERVIQFFDWFHREQSNQDLIMYGVKGEHYRLRGERISYTSEVNGAGLDFPGRNVFANLHFLREAEYMAEGSLASYREYVETESFFPRLFGFQPDYVSTNDLFRNRFLAFDNSPMEKLKTGVFREKDIAEYREFMVDRGMSRLTTALQKQVDAWQQESIK